MTTTSGCSPKATGFSQATHLVRGLQSFENEAKKMSYEDGSKTASACLEVTAKTTFIPVPGREYTGNTSKSGEGQRWGSWGWMEFQLPHNKQLPLILNH